MVLYAKANEVILVLVGINSKRYMLVCAATMVWLWLKLTWKTLLTTHFSCFNSTSLCC